ncbi:hypothetical protein HUJ04_005789 [Dendroctonus ponderosae]|uniref:THAP-type domain-containing protein n=1 Tax=Dendroctonus ponderosae TaxID=77166 RepID=A0AAR5PGD3_DENPD|nr:hypothetical protein HUJ04_005789 [Dendroctonus ponderosae]
MEFNQNRKCCVAGCKSNFPAFTAGIKYHNFPPKLELTAVQLLNEQGNLEAVSRYEAWKRILQLKQPVTIDMTVCSRHFKDDEFDSPDKKSLTRSAIPTLNLPPAPTRKSLRIRSDEDLLMPLMLKDPLALSPTSEPKPVVILNKSMVLPKCIKFGPDTLSKSPILRTQLKRAAGNSADGSANLSPSQSQSSPVPAKRPRVAAIENRNQSSAAPQVFFVGIDGISEPSPVIQSVKKREVKKQVQPNTPAAGKSPANPIIFLKQVPKPVGIKLMPAKNVKLKAIITDVQRKVIVAQPLDQQATPRKNLGEKAAPSSNNPPKVGNSVGKPKAQPSSAIKQLGATAGTARNVDKEKRVICLSSDESDLEASRGAAPQKAYHPVKEYCAFINCATHIEKAATKMAFPSDPATQKVWLERAGIRASLPEAEVEHLFICDKHFKPAEFSPLNVLKPGICPWSYKVYNDSSAIDGNPHWVQKKMRTNGRSTVTYSAAKAKPNTGGIRSSPSEPQLDVCCFKNCTHSDNTTVLHKFPAYLNRVDNPRVVYEIQKRYGGKKVCGDHLSHQFFKTGIFNASAAVFLGLQILWIESNQISSGASAVNIDGLEDSEQEESQDPEMYVPITEYCAFINCATHNLEAAKKFKFPLNEPMRQKWGLRAGIPSSFPVDGLKLLFVCEKHFMKSQFTSDGSVKPLAAPTSYRLYSDPVVNSNGTNWRRKKILTNCVKDFSIIRQPKCCIGNCQEKPTSTFPPLKALGYLIKLNNVSRANLEYYQKQKVCTKHLHHNFCDKTALSKASALLTPSSTQEVLDRITNEAISGSGGEAARKPDVINLCNEEDSAVNASASPQAVYKPMRQYCAVINCATHLKKVARKFLFPTEKDVLNAWRIKAGIPRCVADEDLKMLFICSNHFNRTQFSKWGTLLPGSVPEDYRLYRDPLASDSQPHWLRKKRLTNCASNFPVVEKCAIKDCKNSSRNMKMCPFPSLNGFIKYGNLSKNVINYYENKKICSQHLQHNFFKHRLLNIEAMKLLDLIAMNVNSKQQEAVVWQPFPPNKPAHQDVDFYGDVKGKAILRTHSIAFPHIKHELKFAEDPLEVASMFRYRLEAFTKAGQTATVAPKPGKRVQVHTALIIDDNSEKATVEMIREAFARKGKLDSIRKTY